MPGLAQSNPALGAQTSRSSCNFLESEDHHHQAAQYPMLMEALVQSDQGMAIQDVVVLATLGEFSTLGPARHAACPIPWEQPAATPEVVKAHVPDLIKLQTLMRDLCAQPTAQLVQT